MPPDDNLDARICDAYRTSCMQAADEGSVLWDMIFAKNKPIHDAIVSGLVPEGISRPGDNYLFYGFENLNRDSTERFRVSEDQRSAHSHHTFNLLARLAEAVGIARVYNPNGGALFPNKEHPEPEAAETLIRKISHVMNVDIDFPNPFPDEYGLVTTRGIACDRAIWAIYQAWQIKQLSKQYGTRIVEIGAGLGRTAYYAYRMGLTDYTIVDLPFTNIAQGAFLGRALGADKVVLHGEGGKEGAVHVLPAKSISELTHFDILTNVDSLTEMSRESALRYVKAAQKAGAVIWSVNHEANRERVSGLARDLKSRYPYWLRDGYVEELFVPPRRIGQKLADALRMLGIFARHS